MSYTLHLGDCLTVMSAMQPDSVDAIVTDPPYGLSFMGRDWDHGVPGVPFWEAALRVAKPGAHLLAFGSPRTHHRLMVAIEDAGWELRDCLMWLYGSGFPKSLDIGKQLDRMAGAERDVIGSKVGLPGYSNSRDVDESGYGGGWKNPQQECAITAPATDAAKQWSGFGTNLKPAWEPVILARKPLSEPTIAANVLKWNCGALNIDGCRIGMDEADYQRLKEWSGKYHGRDYAVGTIASPTTSQGAHCVPPHTQGRWPANLALDEDAAALLDAQSGTLTSGKPSANGHRRKASLDYQSTVNYADRSENAGQLYGDSGGASRYFYTSKASRRDRDEGLEGMPERKVNDGRQTPIDNAYQRGETLRHNGHPTVKPTDLMRWLVRLVTPPGGTVLDPFLGSGSTLKAAMLEGFNGVGIDIEQEYLDIADKRLAHAVAQYVKQQEMAALQPRLLSP